MVESRKLAAILAADVAGYSKLAGADEERTLARLRALRSDLFDPTIALHHGRVVKRTGDGVLIEFRSVVDAVRCAIEVQNGMVERNAGLSPERRIEFRVGIHLGEVLNGEISYAQVALTSPNRPFPGLNNRHHGHLGHRHHHQRPERWRGPSRVRSGHPPFATPRRVRAAEIEEARLRISFAPIAILRCAVARTLCPMPPRHLQSFLATYAAASLIQAWTL